ncbi:uncharacterized protein BDR25DRAFT_344918 [Lindgomyces ingoldianus]|uniref:Uncharacterized protein n=1 Tax=Lindgomyces ingoldianus TaxID=673940 RepID=A0ACB6QKV4_9PLEO|nr:uncharacterized protein BDR25DRAFT_344918 [Lindgomyces ingoldianus]KAF2467568.1 hypothetical protein BDR25DRAFT_344918 [Lindgomyces ingoldianus]
MTYEDDDGNPTCYGHTSKIPFCHTPEAADPPYQDDLRSFHTKHFPTAPLPTQFFYGAETPEAIDQSYGDGLGYYKDGVKRTLTDDDIAFLRRSEVMQILRERRRRRDVSRSPEPDFPVQQQVQRPDQPTEDSPLKLTPTSTNNLPLNASTPLGRSKDGVQQGRIGKKNNWVKTSEKTRQRNRKSRRANKKNKKERKKSRPEVPRRRDEEEEEKEEEEEEEGEGEESDEWDPRRQATGPDAIKDTTIDLDY